MKFTSHDGKTRNFVIAISHRKQGLLCHKELAIDLKVSSLDKMRVKNEGLTNVCYAAFCRQQISVYVCDNAFVCTLQITTDNDKQ